MQSKYTVETFSEHVQNFVVTIQELGRIRIIRSRFNGCSEVSEKRKHLGKIESKETFLKSR